MRRRSCRGGPRGVEVVSCILFFTIVRSSIRSRHQFQPWLPAVQPASGACTTAAYTVASSTDAAADASIATPTRPHLTLSRVRGCGGPAGAAVWGHAGRERAWAKAASRVMRGAHTGAAPGVVTFEWQARHGAHQALPYLGAVLPVGGILKRRACLRRARGPAVARASGMTAAPAGHP